MQCQCLSYFRYFGANPETTSQKRDTQKRDTQKRDTQKRDVYTTYI